MSQRNPRAVLRILALPLRQQPTPLTYYHILAPPAAPHVSASLSSPGTADSFASRATHWLKRSASKATEMWDDLGDEKHPETSWKRRVYSLGMHAMDRVPFEETALKAVDVTVLKTLQSQGSGAKPSIQDNMADGLEAVLLHPRVDSDMDAGAQWRTFIKRRIPLHQRAMWVWAGLTPIMLPLAVLPGPNLPMYFTAWRAWGHYQAFNAAQFLSTLPVTTQSSPDLDTIFSATASTSESPASSAQTSTAAASPPGSVTESPGSNGLLTPKRAASLTKLYSLPPHVHTELLRAISQAAKRGA